MFGIRRVVATVRMKFVDFLGVRSRLDEVIFTEYKPNFSLKIQEKKNINHSYIIVIKTYTHVYP